MHKIEAEVILYDNVEELDFCTEHPYWLSINGYVIKISKRVCAELKYMHKIEEPELTDLERLILSNLDKKFKYIARDENGILFVYETLPEKVDSSWINDDFTRLPFDKLFKFVTWDNLCPYVIEDLLEANKGNDTD